MQPWDYEPASDLDKTLAERLRCFPREPDLSIYAVRSLAALLIRGWLRTYHRFRVEGTDHLPQSGSFILVSNHSSHLDTLCLLAALPLRVLHRAFPAAAQDYFFVNVPRLALAAIVVNALPFGRQTHIRQSLELCRQLLSNPGNVLILFPEGTRSISGKLGDFRPGVGLLVAGTRTPVVPCHLDGAREAWPKGSIVPRTGKIRLRIGTPMTFETESPDRMGAEVVCGRLQQAVIDLSL